MQYCKSKLIKKYLALDFEICWTKPSWFLPVFKPVFTLFDERVYFQTGFCLFGNILDIFTNWTYKTDHAGFNILLEIFGLMINFTIYDTRHWDYDNDCWMKYE